MLENNIGRISCSSTAPLIFLLSPGDFKKIAMNKITSRWKKTALFNWSKAAAERYSIEPLGETVNSSTIQCSCLTISSIQLILIWGAAS